MEVGQKISLMGIYMAILQIPEMPATLPKLCIHAQCVTSRDTPFKSLAFELRLGEEILQSHEFPGDVLTKLTTQINEDALEPYTRTSLIVNLTLAPFNIPKEDTLRLVFKADGETLEAGALRLRIGATAQ
ncbi:hypothetical protein [Pandoraea sp. NE5]|uniref:hypothetical protein n=1 Tax=Pandoraea sp. NE5 TaxID=2904129 RepID=UPI0021C4516B|nr:hypothetical protein [Pandoraea sp. NE5]